MYSQTCSTWTSLYRVLRDLGGSSKCAPGGPNSFIFMNFQQKKQNNRLVHPLWELAPSGKFWIRNCRDPLPPDISKPVNYEARTVGILLECFLVLIILTCLKSRHCAGLVFLSMTQPSVHISVVVLRKTMGLLVTLSSTVNHNQQTSWIQSTHFHMSNLIRTNLSVNDRRPTLSLNKHTVQSLNWKTILRWTQFANRMITQSIKFTFINCG